MPKRTKKQSVLGFLLSSITAVVVILLFYLVIAGLLSAISYLSFSYGYVSANTYNYLLYVATLLALSISVFLYMVTYRSVPVNGLPKRLGFGLRQLSFKNLELGVMIFAVVLCLELVVGLLSALTNVQINTNVGQVFTGAPLWFFVFTALIEPINEEIFFRGFLVPRIGVLPSAIVFGLAHYSYNSTFGIEVIAAFIFGLLSGYIYKRTNSLYPGMLAHVLVNSLAALSILGLGS